MVGWFDDWLVGWEGGGYESTRRFGDKGCGRFGEEAAGMQEMAQTDRHTDIATHRLNRPFSGKEPNGSANPVQCRFTVLNNFF